MSVSSTFPPNLSLIGPLTTEIYYRTGITGNHRQTNTETDRQTQTETESDTLPHIGYRIE